ncbi:hypothetical protein [Kribbella sp. VKM Ac-2568]|uniref:hypothetical protein n=1 Tax=Kribbella sp. VKM Ac-2568 TaxID=2512219 RepID=UPI001048E304|nr:hypothetical protein [Kribbella sp. VKM Ac-2568]TCM51341.1 hypothetical protein EV648_101168 [Kribbella sp. VKM Ac-2568]
MKTAVLVSGVVLLGVVGGAAGYETGVLSEPGTTLTAGAAAPLGGIYPAAPLPVKTPVPSDVPALTTAELTFRQHTFQVQASDRTVELAIQVPRGWQLTTNPKSPAEVKFLDPLKERGVRVEAISPPGLSPKESRQKLIVDLEKSQAPENDLRIVSQTDDQIEADGELRAVSTLIYTYIPNKTRRYVIVSWVAAAHGDDLATVEMSITGLPQDAAGLSSVLQEATRSVHETG